MPVAPPIVKDVSYGQEDQSCVSFYVAGAAFGEVGG